MPLVRLLVPAYRTPWVGSKAHEYIISPFKLRVTFHSPLASQPVVVSHRKIFPFRAELAYRTLCVDSKTMAKIPKSVAVVAVVQSPLASQLVEVSHRPMIGSTPLV